MLLQTKYWRYFLLLCLRTGLEVSTMRHIISSLERGRTKRVGDFTFCLVSKENESFGTVYRLEVYEGEKLALKSPVLLHEPLKERWDRTRKGSKGNRTGN